MAPTDRKARVAKRPKAVAGRRRRSGGGRPGQFVGRDPSPVLDRYPPKPAGGSGSVVPPPTLSTPPSPAPPAGPYVDASAPGARPSPEGLIRLERPFDLDEFSRTLGATAIRVTVPHDALAEVLRRVTDFMGFGIYIYSVTVRPTPSEQLKGFVVELQRVDYDPETKAWKPFVERGTVEPSPSE